MKNNNNLLTVIGVAVVVAVIASVITTSITGNTLRVANIDKTQEIYTKAEMDKQIVPVILERVTKIDGYNYISFRNYRTGIPICTDVKVGSYCIVGNTKLYITAADPSDDAVTFEVVSGGIVDKFYGKDNLIKLNKTNNEDTFVIIDGDKSIK